MKVSKQATLAIVGAAVLLLVLAMIYGNTGAGDLAKHPNVVAFLGPLDQLQPHEQTVTARVLPKCSREVANDNRDAMSACWMQAAKTYDIPGEGKDIPVMKIIIVRARKKAG